MDYSIINHPMSYEQYTTINERLSIIDKTKVFPVNQFRHLRKIYNEDRSHFILGYSIPKRMNYSRRTMRFFDRALKGINSPLKVVFSKNKVDINIYVSYGCIQKENFEPLFIICYKVKNLEEVYSRDTTSISFETIPIKDKNNLICYISSELLFQDTYKTVYKRLLPYIDELMKDGITISIVHSTLILKKVFDDGIYQPSFNTEDDYIDYLYNFKKHLVSKYQSEKNLIELQDFQTKLLEERNNQQMLKESIEKEISQRVNELDLLLEELPDLTETSEIIDTSVEINNTDENSSVQENDERTLEELMEELNIVRLNSSE